MNFIIENNHTLKNIFYILIISKISIEYTINRLPIILLNILPINDCLYIL